MTNAYITRVFPLSLFNSENLYYCFPGREFIYSNQERDFSCRYGYMWPIPFIAVNYRDDWTMYIADGETLAGVRICKNNVSFTASFMWREETEKNSLTELHFTGGMRQMIQTFRTWYDDVRGKLAPMTDFMKNVFHVRRYFFYEKHSTSAVFRNGDIELEERYQEDCELTGGCDAGLLFDYSYDPGRDIRCGNADASVFDDIILEKLNRQLIEIQESSGTLFFAYIDPYIVENGSDWDKGFGNRLPIYDENQELLQIWRRDMWHPCLDSEDWQENICDFINKVTEVLHVEGIYLDEFGNGNQYECRRSDHFHKPSDNQIDAEKKFLTRLSDSFPEKVFMTEYAPVDRMNGMVGMVLSDTRTTLNIYRFIFPEIRFVRIVNCDGPIAGERYELNKSFFNGEGLWIGDDVRNKEWYPDDILYLIREQYSVLKEYKKYFSSSDVEPLISSSTEGIMANRFSYESNRIITFLNTDNESAEVPICDYCRKDEAQIVFLNGRRVNRKANGTFILGGHEAACVYEEGVTDLDFYENY